MHSLGLKLSEVGSVSVNFSLYIQPLIRAGPAGCMGGVPGVRAGLGDVPEVCILSTKFAVGRKAFGV